MVKQLALAFLAGCAFYTASAQYCTPAYTAGTTDNDYINGVELETISNLENGPGDGSGYSDFTDLSATLTAGSTYDIFIDNTPSFSETYRIWIDYDQDGIFTSSEEITASFSLTAGSSTTKTFTVPYSASPGTTRLRVRCVYATADFDGCSSETYGEAEDYSIEIIGLTDDLELNTVWDIADGCDLSADEPVTIDITNIGTDPAGAFTVSFMTDGGAVTTESYPGGILPGVTETYTFSGGADLSADGTHVITAWINFGADMNSANDTAEVSIENIYTYLTTGFPSNVCYGGGTIFPSPIAGGGTWSGDGIIDPETGELDPSLLGGVGATATVTYSFVPTAAYTVTEVPFEPNFKIDPTELALGDDATANGINIGFNFTYFGNTYSTCFISSNGLIGFSAPSTSYTPQNFPNATDPDNIIAWCWTDLNPGAGGVISYETTGVAPNRKFIVYYDSVLHYAGDDRVTGQIVLYETSNAIDLIAVDIQSDGGNMTQGIENLDGTVAYNAGAAYNLAVFSMAETTWRYAVTPCSGTVTETIAFIEPPVVVIDDATVCVGTDVTLDAGEGAEYYVWNTGATTQTIDIFSSGTYFVTYYANAACYTSDTAVVVIHPLPVIDLGDDGVACEGTMLDAENPGSAYSWSNGATTQTVFITESGTYDVTVENPVTGCTNADTITMTITPLPTAAYSALATGGLTIVFSSLATDAVTWFWDFGDGTTSIEENPWHTYPAAGDYTVTLVVTNDCGADIYSEVLSAITGVEETHTTQLLSVFPNPSDNVIMLSQTSVPENCHYTIRNTSGQIVLSGQWNNTPIDIHALPSGVYHLEVETLGSAVFVRG